MIDSVDPDWTPHSEASDMGLYCLLLPIYIYPNTQGKYGIC